MKINKKKLIIPVFSEKDYLWKMDMKDLEEFVKISEKTPRKSEIIFATDPFPKKKSKH